MHHDDEEDKKAKKADEEDQPIYTPCSLVKCCVLTISDTVNTKYGKPDEEVLNRFLAIPHDVLAFLFPYLHYRWLDAMLKRKPELRSLALPYIGATMRREEDFQRSKDPLVGQVPLISVFDNKDTFKIEEFPDDQICLDRRSPYSLEDGKVLLWERKKLEWPELVTGSPSVVSKGDFLKNFALFTENQLTNINWNNVFVAGGCVSACLLPIPDEYNETPELIKEFYNEIAYEGSDIDIFLYGLTDRKAIDKIGELVEAIRQSHPKVPLKISKSSQAVTVLREYPYRCTQIIISNFQHKAEVLANFDIDNICVGFDGTDVLCLPRCRNALNTRVNILNSALESVSYRRIIKNQSRGFSFALPNCLTVPLNFYETSLYKLDIIQAFAMMNMLRSHDIDFEDADHAAKWQDEWNFGVTIHDGPRAIDKETVDKASRSFSTIRSDRKNMEWDSSSGVYGISYYKNVTHKELISRTYGALKKTVEELKWDESDFESPWTWDGAPEFRDWTVKDSDAVELAHISWEKHSYELVFPAPSDDAKEPFFEFTSPPDSQGFIYKLTFVPQEEPDDDEDEPTHDDPGFKVMLEVLPPKEDDDYICSVLVLYAFHPKDNKEKDQTIYLDACYNFAPHIENKYHVFVYYDTVDAVKNDNDEAAVTVEFRTLKQKLPLL